MKLFVIAAVLGVAAAGRLDNNYLPPRSGSGFGSAGSFHGGSNFASGSAGFHSGAGASGFQGNSGAGNFHGGAGFGGGFGGQTQHAGNAYNAPQGQYSTRQQSSFEANAQILRQNSDVTAEGFSYDFETSNGIRADASGVATNGVQSQGSFGYKGDDGQDYSITYTADENGYRPQGAHLPTPPPIPEAILKSLEQNARDEAAGISDDGSYHDEGAGNGAGAYNAPSGNYGAPSSGGFGSASSGLHGAGGHGSAGFNHGGSGFQASGNFGGASRQYLAPKAGPARGSGSGNFNTQSGYHY